MKKLMILAVAAIALAACSRTFEHHATEPTQIGFSTWAEHMTKARTQGSSTFASGDDFAVYGSKTVSSTDYTVFDKVVVNTTDGTTWNYTTKQYWDNEASGYKFYAISPSSLGTGNSPTMTVDPSNGAIATSTDIVFAGDDNDILVADKVTVDKGTGAASTYFNSYAAVPIQFNHVAALVDFKVKKSAGLNTAGAKIAITSISLTNIDKAGTLAISAYDNDACYTGTLTNRYHPTLSSSSWTVDGSADKGTFSNASGVGGSVTLPTDVGTTGDDLITNLIVLPQQFRAANETLPQLVTIAYTIQQITGEDQGQPTYGTAQAYTPEAFALKLFDNTDEPTDQTNNATVGGWLPGKHYTFYITIDAHAIDFTAAITDWSTESAYYHLIN